MAGLLFSRLATTAMKLVIGFLIVLVNLAFIHGARNHCSFDGAADVAAWTKCVTGF